jgi:hypothetical protein
MTIAVRGLVTLAALLTFAPFGPTRALAQRAAPSAVSGARAFAVEAVGGTVGSALGIGLGLAIARPDNCPSNEDLACILRRLGTVGIVGVAGATVGTFVAGRWAASDPSIVGALLGAAVGAAAGIGLEHLVTEELNQSLGNAGAVVLFSVTQGILAAAGSRIGAALR